MQQTLDMIEKLNLSGKKLSKSHRRIAEYIAQHYDKAVFMTAARLGETVGVSESTVVRFAVAMGYDGYPQLQHSLQELVHHRLTTTQRFEMISDIRQEDVLPTVLKADMQNIRHHHRGHGRAGPFRTAVEGLVRPVHLRAGPALRRAPGGICRVLPALHL